MQKSTLLLLLVSAVAVAALCPAALSAQATTTPTPTVGQSDDAYVYRIGPGDVLEVKFSYNADMDDTVTVRADGGITLRMIGEVAAADKTPADLSEEVSKRYEEHLKHPTVSVGLKQSANLQVYVGGEVATPRMVPLDGRVTALQAVLSAGGPRVSAKLKEVAWVRKVGENEAVVRTLNLKAIMRGEAEDPELKPYDVLFLSRSNIGVANRVVDQFVNGLMPSTLVFAYNLNTNFRVE